MLALLIPCYPILFSLPHPTESLPPSKCHFYLYVCFMCVVRGVGWMTMGGRLLDCGQLIRKYTNEESHTLSQPPLTVYSPWERDRASRSLPSTKMKRWQTGSILPRSYTDSHSSREFMNALAVLCPGDSSPTSGSYILSSPSSMTFLEPWG